MNLQCSVNIGLAVLSKNVHMPYSFIDRLKNNTAMYVYNVFEN